MTFEEWQATGCCKEDASDHCHWAGPAYCYEGGFIGVDPLGGLTVPICKQDFHFYTLAEAERCLWKEWVRDEYADLMEPLP